MGYLGQSIARMLRAFSARIVYADPSSLPPSQEQELTATHLAPGQLVSASDVIIAAAPLTPSTLGLLGPDVLRLARPERSW
jgi:lactate dehydrogenase-like 2-hydroxyacid dehydrogenase